MRTFFVALIAEINRPSVQFGCCSRGSGGNVELHFMTRRVVGTFEPSFKSMKFLRGRIASTEQLQISALRMIGVGKHSHTSNSTVTRKITNFTSNFAVPTMGIGLLLESQMSGNGICQIYLSFSYGS